MRNFLILLLPLLLSACSQDAGRQDEVRQAVDTVGFATQAWQMDSLMNRMNRQYGTELQEKRQFLGLDDTTAWRVAVSPHDDYAYAGPLYPLLLRPVRASTVFLLGVAHKARQLGMEDRIVFDSHTAWETPYGVTVIPACREEVMSKLKEDVYIVNDSMHAIEHSLEALLPFLQYFHGDVEFVPILVPYMSYERMDSVATTLALALRELALENQWKWGEDFAILVSSDAVHYGDEDWGGSNYAPYGADTAGYEKAVRHEREIIDSCLAGPLSPERIRRFSNYTVREDNYREYKWTWCGRYSVPFGLLTSWHLQQMLGEEPLEGVAVGYMTSIDHDLLPVTDLGMGTTAPASIHHWVGYAAIGFE